MKSFVLKGKLSTVISILRYSRLYGDITSKVLIINKEGNQQSLGVSPILSKSANQNQYWKGETMKEVYWKELLEIFESDEELKINHETLYNNISLIVKANDTHKELEELNKEITELNK